MLPYSVGKPYNGIVFKRSYWQSFALAALLISAVRSSAQVSTPEIIQRSVVAIERDWNAAPDYECLERDREPGGGTKAYEDLMIMGSPYQRLVDINGQPLAPQQQQQEQQKLQTTVAQRRNESAQDRAQRIAKYQKDRARNHLFLQQLTKAFDFTMTGQRKLNGYDVYVLKAVPKPGYEPPNMEAQVLKGMRGTLWIDKQTFQWVKVEAQVIQPVSIEGFLAQVEPGTRFELEKMPVQGDIWLPRHYSMKANAKIFFLFNHKTQDDETYYSYHAAEPVSNNTAQK
jgi:hypothetical protein